jgi:hypothetical protein
MLCYGKKCCNPLKQSPWKFWVFAITESVMPSTRKSKSSNSNEIKKNLDTETKVKLDKVRLEAFSFFATYALFLTLSGNRRDIAHNV